MGDGVAFEFEGERVEVTAKRGTRLAVAYYTSLYNNIGTALPEGSPVLVADLRGYCKIVCFTEGLTMGGAPGLLTDGSGRFVPPLREDAVDVHLEGLNGFMACYPELTDRVIREVDRLNPSLDPNYDPDGVGENLD